MRVIWLVILSLWLMVGCSPLKIQLLPEELSEKSEDEIILNKFQVEGQLIIKAYKEANIDTFYIAKWYNEYIKT
ncbi:unnamed protein product, partial [marine sediment metagenome]